MNQPLSQLERGRVLPRALARAGLTGILAFQPTWPQSLPIRFNHGLPSAADSSRTFREDFGEGWINRWMEQVLGKRRNHYEVEEEGGNAALRVTSDQAASLLWHRLAIRPGAVGRISWRWRVQATIPQNAHERERRGDDYAGRLFVVFDSRRLSRETRAICYVWAAHESVGAIYRSPYASGVAMIVVESGNERAGEWLAEERDFAADYREAFGQEPETVGAVAIMVDTDNTRSQATAWFGDIEVGSGLPASAQRQLKAQATGE